MSIAATAATVAPKMGAKPLLVRRAAVLGAGTMGSRIAAHLANAGIPTLLLDLPAKAGSAERAPGSSRSRSACESEAGRIL